MDEGYLRAACTELAKREASFEQTLDRWGTPPLWERAQGFATMVHIILEQQVSLASANATWDRLQALLSHKVEPASVLSLADETLSSIGFTRQKIRYVKDMAVRITHGQFSFEELALLDDESARARLMSLLGIGEWSAAIYLSECLLRPDILPKGDIAVLEQARQMRGLQSRPNHDELLQIAQPWRPYRSVATRLMWHRYLNSKDHRTSRTAIR
jgi:DNA-3-methyladenine glycosylase II